MNNNIDWSIIFSSFALVISIGNLILHLVDRLKRPLIKIKILKSRYRIESVVNGETIIQEIEDRKLKVDVENPTLERIDFWSYGLSVNNGYFQLGPSDGNFPGNQQLEGLKKYYSRYSCENLYNQMSEKIRKTPIVFLKFQFRNNIGDVLLESPPLFVVPISLKPKIRSIRKNP